MGCSGTPRTNTDEHFLMSRYGPQLEAWLHTTLLSRGRRRRSVNLPAGHVGFRTSRPNTLITDPQSLIVWCKMHLPEAYTVRVRTMAKVLFA